MNDLKRIISEAVDEAIALRGAYRQTLQEWLLLASEKVAAAFTRGNKLLIAGNGGSAADSQHFAAEMIVRLSARLDRAALPVIALTVDSSILTACANDYGYQSIFSRQLEALGQAGDIFIGISTSGRSANIIEAFRTAREKSMTTFGLFGKTTPKEPELCDLSLLVPGQSVMRIQEEHIFALHLLVELTEVLYFHQ